MNIYTCTHCGAEVVQETPPKLFQEFLCDACRDEGWSWEDEEVNEKEDHRLDDPRHGQASARKSGEL